MQEDADGTSSGDTRETVDISQRVLTTAEANREYPVIYTFREEFERLPDGSWRASRVHFYPQKCHTCHAATTHRCGFCKRVAYCCKAHQTEDWQRHRGRECREMHIRHQHFLDSRESGLKQIAGMYHDKEIRQLTANFSFTFQPDCGKEHLGYRVHNRSFRL